METALDSARFWFVHSFQARPSNDGRDSLTVELVLVEGLQGPDGEGGLVGRPLRPDQRSRYARVTFDRVVRLEIRPEWTDGISAYETFEALGPVTRLLRSRLLDSWNQEAGLDHVDPPLSPRFYHYRVYSVTNIFDIGATDAPHVVLLPRDRVES